MRAAVVDFTACAAGGCGTCRAAKACEKRVLVKIDGDEPAFVDRSLCTACGDCLPACPHDAITMIDG